MSMTGILDNKITNGNIKGKKDLDSLAIMLGVLRHHAIAVNEMYAKKLGISKSKAITTVKPSGTVSQLVGSSSGIHPRYSQYYIRRVRASNKDPLAIWMKEMGVPCEQDIYNKESLVFSFPSKSPEGAVLKDDITSIDHLELWRTYKKYWTEHNPSATIYVEEDQWMKVGNWIYENWNDVCGLSFLPSEDHMHTYLQAPYESITEEEYEKLLSEMPDIDFSSYNENEDNTTASQELSCNGDNCEIK